MGSAATLARPYARAVFAAGAPNRWAEMLELMAGMATMPEVAEAAADPGLDRAGLAAVLIAAAGERLDEAGANLLRLLAENRRLALLPLILETFSTLVAEANRRAVAEVVSARPLSEAQERKLRAALERITGGTVVLDCHVDALLVGGATVRLGDRVIDGSVIGRLRGLARRLR